MRSPATFSALPLAVLAVLPMAVACSIHLDSPPSPAGDAQDGSVTGAHAPSTDAGAGGASLADAWVGPAWETSADDTSDVAFDGNVAVAAGSAADGTSGPEDLDGAADGGPPVPRGPTWANWPMPNPASSGLPNPASYDTSTPGIVIDQVTGLSWEASDHGGYGSMRAAAAYCASLRLGGFADWRLPSRIEIWSIQDFTRFDPALDPAFTTFGTNENRPAPWTSTPGHGEFEYADAFYTSQGVQSVESITGSESSPVSAVRCVRGSTAQPDPHYTIGDGTVFDHGTGLTWQQDYDVIPSLPNGVANYCASLTLGGGGWRPPSVKELETIVDDLLIEPALDATVFHYPSSGVNNLVFWSSSPWMAVPQDGESVYVNFHDGETGTGDNSIPGPLGGNDNFMQVRCVK